MNFDNSPNDFLIFEFDRDEESSIFSRANQKLLLSSQKLNLAIDKIFRRSVPANRKGITIFMLGRTCIKNFHSILMLCTNGHGCDAMKILRSMFEKMVDAKYLHKHPEEIDMFWDFYLLQLKNQGFEEIAEKSDKDYLQKIEKFKIVKKGKRTKFYRISWSEKNLKARAKSVGISDFQIQTSYSIANSYVHTSVKEFFDNLDLEPDGSLSPTESVTEKEREQANLAFSFSYWAMLQIMELVIEHYDFQDAKPIFDECLNEFKTAIKSKKSN